MVDQAGFSGEELRKHKEGKSPGMYKNLGDDLDSASAWHWYYS